MNKNDNNITSVCKIQTETGEVYFYGMRMRAFAPGAQPMIGIIDAEDDPTGRYYTILTYERRLTDDEIYNYELDDLNNTGCGDCDVREEYTKNDR